MRVILAGVEPVPHRVMGIIQEAEILGGAADVVTRRQRVMEDMIGTVEASRILGVSVKTVQWWFDAGNLKGAVRADGRRLISRSHAEQLAMERSSADRK